MRTNQLLRNYQIDTPQHLLYKDMYANQTLDFVNKKKE